MTKHICIILVLAPLISMAQFDYIDQQELYVINNIKSIQRIYHLDDIEENREMWRIDSNGRIIFNELSSCGWIPNSDITIWNYSEHVLLTKTQIASWNTKTHKLDTASTKYYYNDSHLLIKTQYTNTRNNDTVVTLYEYNNDLLIGDSFYYGDYNREYSTYSYDFFDSNKIKKESKTVFRKNDGKFYLFYKIEKEFDNSGSLLKEIMFTPSLDTSFVSTFIYEDNKLIKIQEEYYSEKSVKPVQKYETIYEYNDLGLVSEVREIDDEVEVIYETYKYE